MYDVSMTKQRSVVAERIEELLRRKDMSAAELSRASGVSESAISNILEGKRTQLRGDTIRKIAKGFGTTSDFMNGFTDDWRPSDAPPLPDFAVEVLERMRELDRARNYELLLIAESFVGANKKLRQITRQEFVDMILDAGDSLGNEEDTNRIMEVLQELEHKWTDSDDNDPPLLVTDEPSEPGE